MYIIKTKGHSDLTRLYELGGIPQIIWGPGCVEDAIEWMAIKGMEFTPIDRDNVLGFCQTGEDWDEETYFLVKK